MQIKLYAFTGSNLLRVSWLYLNSRPRISIWYARSDVCMYVQIHVPQAEENLII